MEEVNKGDYITYVLKGEEGKVYSFVNTTRTKYYGFVDESIEKKVVIKNAIELNEESDNSPNEVAKEYVRGLITGKTKTVNLKPSLIESVSEAPEESRITKMYLSLLPLAQKQAFANAIFESLDELFESE